MPTSERSAAAGSRAKGRNVVILVLALLSGMVAGAAVYLVVIRRGSHPTKPTEAASGDSRARTARPAAMARGLKVVSLARPREPGRTRAPDRGTPPGPTGPTETPKIRSTTPDARVPAPEPGPAEKPPGPRPGRPDASVAAPEPRPAEKPALTTVKWKDVRVVPLSGRRKRSQLDLLSFPPGASVIYSLKVIGKAPLRLQLSHSRLYTFHLHKDRYKLYSRRVKMPRRGGREVKVYLKRLRTKIRQGKPRRTAIKVVCRTEGVFRVYLNGLDSGYHCPVTLASGVGRQSIGLYLPHKDRIVYRKVKARYRKHVQIKWKY